MVMGKREQYLRSNYDSHKEDQQYYGSFGLPRIVLDGRRGPKTSSAILTAGSKTLI